MADPTAGDDAAAPHDEATAGAPADGVVDDSSTAHADAASDGSASDDGVVVRPTIRAGTDEHSVEVRGSFSEKDVQGYVPSFESDLLRFSVEAFEGPLDLLLFLIDKHALDVLDIPINRITAEYLKVIDGMRDLNLDIAGEFLVMAAQLAHIKSKMLLPREERKNEPQEEVDPRAELVRRLLEYQRFKDAAQRLDALPMLGRDVFPRPAQPVHYDAPVEFVPETGLNLAEVDVVDLIRLLDQILKRQDKLVVHEVIVERISVGARINEMVDIFSAAPSEEFRFDFLVDRFGTRTRRNIIVTFLSILEMARLRLVRVRQGDDGLIRVTGVEANLQREGEELKSVLDSVDEFDPASTDDSADDSDTPIKSQQEAS
jgi:segregation and condensation protein A